MGITIFKIFIWGGISSDIRSEIAFDGSAPYEILEYSYPLNDNTCIPSLVNSVDPEQLALICCSYVRMKFYILTLIPENGPFHILNKKRKFTVF